MPNSKRNEDNSDDGENIPEERKEGANEETK